MSSTNNISFPEVKRCREVVFAENDFQLVKSWQLDNANVWEDDDTGLFIVSFYEEASRKIRDTVINADGEYLTENHFDNLDEFQDGMAQFYSDDKLCGYVNCSGEIVFPPIYANAGNFYNGFAFAMKGGKWLLLNKKGKTFSLPEKYKKFDVMNCSRAAASTMLFNDKNFKYYNDCNFMAGLWGYIDECGKEVIAPQYIFAYDFMNNSAVVCRGKWEQDSDNLWWSKEELWGIIDTEGKEVVACKYDNIFPFYNTPDVYCVHTGGWESGKWGIMDSRENWLIPPISDNKIYEEHFQDGLCIFSKDRFSDMYEKVDEIYGIYDVINHKVLCEPQFEDIDLMDNGLLCVKRICADGERSKTVIDRHGKVVFNSDHSKDGILVMQGNRKDRLYDIINIDGRVILPCKYKMLYGEVLHNEKNFIFLKNGFYGVMDIDGNILIPAAYKILGRLNKRYFSFKDGDFWGILSIPGDIILPAQYEMISKCSNNRIIARTQNHIEVFEIICNK